MKEVINLVKIIRKNYESTMKRKFKPRDFSCDRKIIQSEPFRCIALIKD